jgi:acyl CoA:acetate/3-ketoacid CoA transferase alpha subunit
MFYLGLDRVMADKRAPLDALANELRDGMTVGIGGWGARRKPMALVEAVCASPVRELTVVSFGGPDVGGSSRPARCAD